MTFNQLLYLTEVAKYGSINKAAQANYISQSSISTAIKELENEFDIVIFKRSGRGVEPTEEGQEFLSYAVSLIKQKEWLENRFKNGNYSDAPRFSVSMQHYPFAVDAFIRMMENEHSPQYYHTLNETDLEEVIKNISEDRADVGIIYMASRNRERLLSILSARNLVFREIAEVAPSIFIRKDHPLSSRNIICTEDLECYPYISFMYRDGLASEFQEEYLPSDTITRNKRIQVSDRQSMMDMIKSSDSYTIGTGLISGNYSTPGIISKALATKDRLHIGYIVLKNRELDERTNAFISYLAEAMEDSLEYTSNCTHSNI